MPQAENHFLKRLGPRRIQIRGMRLLLFLVVAFSPLRADWKALGPFGGSIEAVAVDQMDPDTVGAATANGMKRIESSA